MAEILFAVEIDDESIEVTVDAPEIPISVGDPEATFITVAGEQGPPGPAGGVVQRIAAQALSGHRAVTPNNDGTVDYADASNAAHLNRPIWLTTGAWSSGALATLVAAGPVTEPTWNWIPGLPIWLGLNGALTQAIPGSAVCARQLARVINPTTIEFTTQQPIVLA